MAAFKRNQTCDSKVTVIVFIVIVTGMSLILIQNVVGVFKAQVNISDMAAFERNQTCDSKVAVIVFIVIITGMSARPFTAGFLNRLFYHEEHMLVSSKS